MSGIDANNQQLPDDFLTPRAIGQRIEAELTAGNLNRGVLLVESRRRIYHAPTDWEDGQCWSSPDGDSAVYDHDPEFARIDEAADGGDEVTVADEHDEEELVEYRRIGFTTTWHVIAVCFSVEGAELYLRKNGHNFPQTRLRWLSEEIGAAPARNLEMCAVVDHLASLRSSQPAPLTQYSAGSELAREVVA
ncbi:MAG: hypothetical protein ACI81R_001919 [Bradymonadia bacterium]|jgi:hypothetical protein